MGVINCEDIYLSMILAVITVSLNFIQIIVPVVRQIWKMQKEHLLGVVEEEGFLTLGLLIFTDIEKLEDKIL